MSDLLPLDGSGGKASFLKNPQEAKNCSYHGNEAKIAGRKHPRESHRRTQGQKELDRPGTLR